MREAMKCLAPLKSDIWFGWLEMPDLSKVMRTSMVAVGCWLPFVFIGFVRFGAKAEDRRAAIFVLSHVLVIESGKFLDRGVSINSTMAQEG
jgi:hypothetical protein